MKVVILAGGYGTRLSEETTIKPKPMVEIGGKPIIWHIMKIYSHFGFNDFIVCLGYKGDIIKDYFYNYVRQSSNLILDFEKNTCILEKKNVEPWKVSLIDTGLNTMTGGRLLKIKDYIDTDDFMMTYGDGVADVNINGLIEFHKKQNRIATITSVQPSGRFGALVVDENRIVSSYHEKPQGDGSWVNGGYFIMNKRIFNYIENDQTIFEFKPLENLAKDGQLAAFEHSGFWMPMDKLSDKMALENMWNNNQAPWKLWK